MKRRAVKHETVVRTIDVQLVTMSASITAERGPSNTPQQQATAGLVIVGDMTQPLNDQTRVELRVYATDAQLGNGDPPAFGVIVVGDGTARIGAFVRREYWTEVWAMASQGALKCCRVSFTSPTRGQGLVTGLDMSNGHLDD